MIVKSGATLYLFDIDYTLFGNMPEWKNFWKNTRNIFKYGPHINPGDFDIRWAVLTGRPKIDKPIIWYLCHSRGLHPQKIFTTDTMFYNAKCDTDIFKYKERIIKEILDEKRLLKFSNFLTSRIFYIDNDVKCLSYLNSNRKNYEYIALSIIDFQQQNFKFMV
jgi:hypothetical protein|tara:strand:+ start:231 stop:719 length:489 start_codon:yes stop_codon:yes gene_type:complete